MVPAYEHAAFISYKRNSPSHRWVTNHFYPLLRDRLPECLPPKKPTSIFVDQNSVHNGTKWPEAIKLAIKRSKILIPIFCPSYFQSDWCMCELQSMMLRETEVGKRADGRSCALILPIDFTDGRHFPSFVQAWAQRISLEQWNCEFPVFRETVAYPEFDRKVWDVAKDAGRLILDAPDFRDDFPLELNPDISPEQPIELPRLRVRQETV